MIDTPDDRRPAWLFRPPGLVPYALAYGWMHEVASARLAGAARDSVVLLEHPPVYTAGRLTSDEHVVWDQERMRAEGAEFHRVDRGGSVTFHGPGQLVGYVVMDLGAGGDVVRFVRDLEEAVIRACADLGVRAERDPPATGVWSKGGKLCAIGVRVKRARVTLHGFALNCTTDLAWFDGIVPCGLAGREVTSLSELSGRPVGVEEVAPVVAARLGSVFGMRLEDGPATLARGLVTAVPV